MRLFVFCLIIVVLISCKNKFSDKTYSENKVSLSQNEQLHPEVFLKISSDIKKNIFGTTVIKGKIINTASVCAYKNTRIKMLCYDNNIRVEEHEDLIDKIIKPGREQSFKTKYHLPKGTDSIALSIMHAEPIVDSTK